MAFRFAQSATVPLLCLGAGILIPTVILGFITEVRFSRGAEIKTRLTPQTDFILTGRQFGGNLVQDAAAKCGDLLFYNVEVLDFAGPFEVFSRTRLTQG